MYQEGFNPIAELPMGFGMALAQYPQAMAYFSELSPDRQRDLIEHTHTINSKDEMKAFVRSLTGGQYDFGRPSGGGAAGRLEKAGALGDALAAPRFFLYIFPQIRYNNVC